MPRQKLYYTTKEIETGLYSVGNEFQYTDGTPFKGQYHKYTTGEIYSGAAWNAKTSKKLVPIVKEQPTDNILYRNLNANLKTKYNSVRPVPVTITNRDVKNGYVKRFIFNKINDGLVTEVDQTQYQEWQSGDIDNNIYSAVTFKWYITGNLETSSNNGVLTEGVLEKNSRIINLLKTSIPTITNHITSPTEYYIDSLIVVTNDINGLDS